MTEAASQITAHPLTGRAGPARWGCRSGVELRMSATTTRRSADPTASASRAEVGQVEIRGPSVIDAYAGEHATDRFRAGGWLRTGDLGYRDADGFLYLSLAPTT